MQQVEQTLGRQLRIQRQVRRTRLETAEHHAEQRQAALCQQGHGLINANSDVYQGPTKPVGAGIEIAVRPLLLKAGGNHLVRMGRHLLFKQAHIALFQRVVTSGVVTRLQQGVALGTGNYRQVCELALGMFTNGQQQALEVSQQALGGGVVEEAFVVRQVQAERIAGVHHHGHRVVGVGARAV